MSGGGRRAAVAEALRRLAPGMPAFEREVVIDRALDSPGLAKAAPEAAAWLALVAMVRHVFTDYDDLLAEGYDRDAARHFVADDMATVFESWGVRRRLPTADEDDGEDDDAAPVVRSG
jgi:hypothetical protein